VVKSVLAAALTVTSVTKKSVSVERPIWLMVVVVSVLKKLVEVVSVEKLVEIIEVLVEVLVEVVVTTLATEKKAEALSPTGGLAAQLGLFMHPVTVTASRPGGAAESTMKEAKTFPPEIEHASVPDEMNVEPLGDVTLQATSPEKKPVPVIPTGVPGGPDH
jgi:hypothetical protein